MKQILLISFLLTVLTSPLFSQQLDLVNNTHFNLFEENLAFSGNYTASHFSAKYFKLWSVNGAPESFSFSAHTPVASGKMGIGIRANRTAVGAHEEIRFKAAGAYKLALEKGRLSFGLALGFVQYNFNTSELNALDPDDILIATGGLNAAVLDFDFATIYTTQKSYLGLEINQLNKANWQLNSIDSSAQLMHLKAIGGHVFKLKNENFFRLSAHVRADENLTPQADVLANFSYDKKFWIGGGYRLNYGLLANLEINLSSRLHAGYGAAIPLGTERMTFNASHTVFVGYMLPTDQSKPANFRFF